MAKRTRGGRSGKTREKVPARKEATIVRLVPPACEPPPRAPPPHSLMDRACAGQMAPGAVLLEAACALAHLAERSNLPLDIDAARIVDAIWLARRRADAAILAKWGRPALKYLATRTEDERWSFSELPPRAKLDRAVATSSLVDVARRIGAADLPPEGVGKFMALAVARLFPALCPEPFDAEKFSAATEKIAKRWDDLRASKRNSAEVDPEQLARAALGAFGVSAGEAWNWIRGISVITGDTE